MSNSILVTFSIPIHNVESSVKECLMSAFAQTYDNMEYLLVDDKSTDHSMEVVEALVSTHPRKEQIRIIDHGVNRGLGDTRNTAIDEAKGRYIYFMDSDDLVTPDCIEKLVTYMQETPVDFVASSRNRCSFNGNLISEDVYEPYLVENMGPYSVARFRYVENHKILAEIWNKLYDVNFLRKNKIRCIPGVHVEDVSFSLQVNLHARSCRLVSDITYTYHIYEGQSFAAFNNNEQRALYLADCFVKIRDYDTKLLRDLSPKTFETGAMMAGIFNVVLLHAGMIQRSKILSIWKKMGYYKKLWIYPLPLYKVLQLKTKQRINLAYWLFCLLPVFIKTICLTYYNRNHG